jgi:hypothetical protein
MTEFKSLAQAHFVIGFGMALRDAPPAAQDVIRAALRSPSPQTLQAAMDAVDGYPVRAAMVDALVLIGIEASTLMLEGVDHV